MRATVTFRRILTLCIIALITIGVVENSYANLVYNTQPSGGSVVQGGIYITTFNITLSGADNNLTNLDFTAPGVLPAGVNILNIAFTPALPFADPGVAFNCTMTWTVPIGQATGPYAFTIRARTDRPQNYASASFTVTVTAATPTLTFDKTSPITSNELSAITFDANASGGTGGPYTFSISGAPIAATINSTNGNFSWTPSETEGPGVYTFNVSVTDGVSTTSLAQTINVTEVNDGPTAIVFTPVNGTAGAVYPNSPTATDTDQPSIFTWNLPIAPVGMTIDPNTGVISWIPNVGQIGPNNVTIRVTNTLDGDFDLQPYTITVDAPPALSLTFVTPSPQTGNEESFIGFDANANGGTGGPYVFSIANAPANMTGTINPTTGVFSWIPAEVCGGNSYTFDVKVFDGTNTTTLPYTINVSDVNKVPVLNDASVIFLLGSSNSYVLTATDTDVPVQALTYNRTGGTALGSLVGNIFSWTPAAVGAYTLIAQVTDSYSSSSTDNATISINVVNSISSTFKVICNTVQISATAPAGTVYNWTNIGSLSANITNPTLLSPTVTLTGGYGTYLFQLTTNTNTYFVQVDFSALTAGPDQSLCTNSGTFAGTNPATLNPVPSSNLWTKTSGSSAGTIANISSYNSNVTTLGSGVNGFTWTVTQGICQASDEVLVNNNTTPVANGGADVSVCNTNYTLMASPPSVGSGRWYNSSGTLIAATPTVAIVLPNQGINTYRWEVRNGTCPPAIDNVTITNNTPTPADAGSDFMACTANNQFNANQPDIDETGTWTKISGSGNIVAGEENDYNAHIENLQYGTSIYRWTISNATCTGTDASEDFVQINSYLIDIVDNTSTESVCGTTGIVKVSTSPDVAGVWTTVPPGGFNITTANNKETEVTSLAVGANTFRWTASVALSTCNYSIDATVNRVEPVASANASEITDCDDNVTLTGAGGIGYWMVVSGNGTFAPNSTSNTVTVTGSLSGENVYRWTVQSGACFDSDDVTVTNDRPSTADGGTDAATCVGTYLLSASPVSYGVGKWYKGGSEVAATSTYNATLVSGTNLFEWRVESVSGVCPSLSDWITITSNKPTQADAGADFAVCGSTAQFNASIPLATETGTWSEVSGAGNVVAGETNLYNAHIENLQYGTSIYKWTISNATCTGTDASESYVTITCYNVDLANNTTTEEICDSDEDLRITTNPVLPGQWSNVPPAALPVVADLNNINTTVSNLQPGANTFRWTVTGGIGTCNKFIDVIISRNSATANAGADQNICTDNTMLVSTDAAGTWSKVTTHAAIIGNSSSPSTAVTALARGVRHTFRWTVAHPTCTISETVDIYNNTFDIDAGPDIAACSSVNTLPYQSGQTWTVISSAGSPTFATNSITTTVSNLATGDNILQWSVTQNGCSDTDEINVKNSQPVATASADAREICINSVTVRGNIPATGVGYWTVMQGSGSFAPNTASNVAVVTGLATGNNIYRWTVADGACTKYAEVTVAYGSVAVADAGAPQFTCDGTAPLSANDPTAGATTGSGEWSVVPGMGSATFTNSTLHNTGVTALGFGENTLRWTISSICGNTFDDVVITNNEAPIALAGADQILCAANGTLEAAGAYGSGSWTLVGSGATVNIADLANPTSTFTISASGAQNTRTLRWTVNSGGCTSIDEVVVKIDVPTTAVAGAPASFCGSSRTLSANTPLVGTGMWSVGGVGSAVFVDPTLPGTIVNSLSVGQNDLVWTITSSCGISSSVVTLTSQSVGSYAGPDDDVCGANYPALQADDPTILSATAVGTWTALNGSAAQFVDANDYNTAVTNLSAGANDLMWTVTDGGCNTTDIVVITNTQAPVDAGNNITICANATATEDVTMQFSPAFDNTSTIYTPSVINGSGTLAYIAGSWILQNVTYGRTVVRVTASQAGCNVFDDVEVNKVPQAVVNNGNGDETICSNMFSLIGNDPLGNNTGNWYLSSGSGSIVSATSFLTTINGLGIGANMIEWHIIAPGCPDDVASFTITSNQPTIPAVGVDNSLTCDGNVTLSTNAISRPSETGKWSFTSGSAIFANETSENTTAVVDPGNNTIRWTVTRGTCTEFDEIVITSAEIPNPPGVAITLAATTCELVTPIQGTDPLANVGTWSVDAGNATFGDPNSHITTISNLNPGQNIIRWSIAKGTCTYFATATITNNRPSTPNAGINQEVCTDFANLSGNILTIGTGTWEKVPAGAAAVLATPSSNQTTVTGMVMGNNTFRYYSRNAGCTLYDEIVVVRNEVTVAQISHAQDFYGRVVPDAANTFDELCTHDAQLFANTVLNGIEWGEWTVTTGIGTFDTPSLETTFVRAMQEGPDLNVYRWTIHRGGCSTYDEIEIINNALTSNAGIDEPVCSDTYRMNPSRQPQYFVDPSIEWGEWTTSSNATIANPTLFRTWVNGLDIGENEFTWTMHKGICSDADKVIITNAQPPMSVAGPDEVVCTHQGTDNYKIGPGHPAYQAFPMEAFDCKDPDWNPLNAATTLAANEPPYGVGRWTVLVGGGQFLDDTSHDTQVYDLDYGLNTFRWTITYNGCTVFDEVDIYNGLPTPADADQEWQDIVVCGDYAFLEAQLPGRATTSTWYNVLGGTATIANQGLYNTLVENLETGNPPSGSFDEPSTFAAEGAINKFEWVLTYSTAYSISGLDPNKISIVPLGDPAADNTVTCELRDTVAITAIGADILMSNAINQTICDTRMDEAPGLDPEDWLKNPTTPYLEGYWTVIQGRGNFTDPEIFNSEITNIGYGTNTYRYSAWIPLNYGAATPTMDINGNHPNGDPYLYECIYGAEINEPKQYCVTMMDVNITNDLPSTPNANIDYVTCTNDENLTADNPLRGTGQWSNVVGNGVIANPFNNNTPVTGMSAGSNTFLWTVTNNACTLRDTLEIFNNHVDVLLGNDQIVCEPNNLVFLDASDPSNPPDPLGIISGNWTSVGGGSTIANSTLYNSQVSNLAKDLNVFRWTLSRTVQGAKKNVFNGVVCTNSDTLMIINKSPNNPQAGADQQVCDNFTQLIASPVSTTNGEYGVWSVVSSLGSPILNLTSAQHIVDATNMGQDDNTFRWTLINEGNIDTDPNPAIPPAGFVINALFKNYHCELSDEVVVTNNYFEVNTVADVTVCTPNPSGNILEGDYPSGSTSGTWTLRVGNGFPTLPNASSTAVTVLGQGDNTFRWTVIKNACTAFDEIIVTNNAPTTASISGATVNEVCVYTFTLNANIPTNGTGSWSEVPSVGYGVIADPTNNTSLVSDLALGQQSGFRWTINNNGCTSYADVFITNNYVYSASGSDISGTSGVTQNICTNATVLEGNPPDLGTGTWTKNHAGPSIASVNLYNSDVSNLPANTIVNFVWTVRQGTCSAVSNYTIRNNSFTTNFDAWLGAAAAGGASNVATTCDGNFTMNARAPGAAFSGFPAPSGYWETVSGSGTFANRSSRNTTVTGLSTNENNYRWTVYRNGCSASSDIVVLNFKTNSFAGDDASICTNTYNLSATNPDPGTGIYTFVVTGTWANGLVGGGTFTPNNTWNALVSNLAPGQNELKYTTTKQFVGSVVGPTGTRNFAVGQVPHTACTATDVVIITNNQPTEATIDPISETCVNSINVSAVSPFFAGETGQWVLISGGGTFANPTSFVTTLNSTKSGINEFSWTISNNGCTSTAIATYTNNTVTSFAGADRAVCSNDTTLYAAEPVVGVGTWTSTSPSFVGTIVTSTVSNSAVQNLALGDNSFRWTVRQSNCSAIDDVVLTNNLISANAGIDKEVCTSDNIQLLGNNPNDLTNGSPVAKGQWTVVGNIPSVSIANSTNYNTTVSGLQLKNNTFEWKIENKGCISTNEVTITNNKTFSNAGINVTTCDTEIDLDADDPLITSPIATGVWVSKAGSTDIVNSTLYNSHINDLVPGVNVYEWTVTEGSCTAQSEVVITSNAVETISAGSDQVVCDDFSTLTANAIIDVANSFGSWTPQSTTASVLPTTSNVAAVTGLISGNNKFVWTVTRGTCSKVASVIVRYDYINAEAGTDQASVCNVSEQTSLAATDPEDGSGIPISGAWTVELGVGASVVTPSDKNTTVNLAPGLNRFRWTVTKGTCTDWDEMEVNNSLPYVNAGADKDVCSNSTTLIGNDPVSINPTATGEWTSVNTTATVDNPNSYTTGVSALKQGTNTFRWTITNNGCTYWDDIVITNYSVAASAGVDQDICGNSTTLAAISPNVSEGESGSWSLGGGAGLFNATSLTKNAVVTNLGRGDNIFIWTVTNGICTNTDAVTVSRNTPDPASVGSDQEVCEATTTISANDPAYGTGRWSTPGSATFGSETDFITTVTNLDEGENIFVWTITDNLCTEKAELIVINSQVTAGAGADIEICEDSYNLSAVPTELGVSGQWTKIGTTATIVTASAYNSNITNLEFGSNIFNWTVSKGSCTDTDEVEIISHKVTINAGADKEVCLSTTSLAATNTASGIVGEWTSLGTATVAVKTLYNTTVNGMIVGINKFQWKVSAGICSLLDVVEITNNSVSSDPGLADFETCNTDEQLSGIIPPSGSGYWTKSTGSLVTFDNSSLNNTWVRNLAKGDNELTWHVTKGTCTASEVLTITNKNPYVYAGDDQEVCVNYTQLNGNNPNTVVDPGGTGMWTTSGTAHIVTPTAYNSDVTSLSSGANLFSWTVTKGICSFTDQVLIMNKSFSVSAGVSKAICENFTTLNAPDPLPNTGVWSLKEGDGNFTTPSAYNSAVTNVQGGKNIFVWTVTKDGCTSSATVMITNNEPSNAEVVPVGEICFNFGDLTATKPSLTGEYGLWTNVASAGIISTSTDNVTTVTGLNAGSNTFKWTVYSGTCTKSANVEIINNSVTIDAGESKVVCGTTTQLDASDPTMYNSTGAWTSQGSAHVANLTLHNSQVTGLEVGPNAFTWMVTKGICSKAEQITITNNYFVTNAGNDITSCESSEQLGADALQVGDVGLWTPLGGGVIINANTPNAIVTGLTNGIYSFEWSVTRNGCVATDIVVITNNRVSAEAGNVPLERCLSTNTLGATQPTVGTGKWTLFGASGGMFTSDSQFDTEVTNIQHGENTYRWTVTSNGCTAHDDVKVYNYGVTADAGVDRSVCASTVNLDGTEPQYGVGTWTPIGGTASITTDTQFDTEVTNLPQGSGQAFQWKVVDNGCSSIDNVLITNNSVEAKINSADVVYICKADTIMPGINPTVGSGQWSIVSALGALIANTADYNSAVTLGKGSNNFLWTVTNFNCSDDITVEYVNNSFVIDGGDAQNVCISEAFLAGEPPVTGNGATGVWTWLGAPTVETPTKFNSKVTGLTVGTNSFTWTITQNRCTATDNAQITNHFFEVSAGIDDVTCVTSYNLSVEDPANIGGTGVWTPFAGNSTFANASTHETQALTLDPGPNKLIWTVTKGDCTAKDDVIITNNAPNKAIAGTDQNICVDFTTLVGNEPDAINGETGKWSTFGGAQITDINIYSTNVTDLDQGGNTFSWTLTKNGCTSTDAIIVTSNAVSADAGNDVHVCVDFATVEAVAPLFGTGSWSYINGSGAIDSQTDTKASVSGLNSNQTILQWTVTKGVCTAYDQIAVTNSAFTINAGPDDEICDATYTLKGQDPGVGGTGVWRVISGGGTVVEKTNAISQYIALNHGVYQLEWKVTRFGCVDTDEVTITNNMVTADAGQSPGDECS